jgi:hypothetical protein
LAVDPIESFAYEFTTRVEHYFAGLMQAATRVSHSQLEPSLGGKLLYAGELDAEVRALVIAANIAGAASITSTANAAAAKQAMRDGVVDFLVTSLDEALRILKNEIRKRETVAVCVAVAPEMLEEQMQERGVAPDLVRKITNAASPRHRASQVQALAAQQDQLIVAWSVTAAPALWMPKLDAIALSCIDSENGGTRRWLRLGPRYLGRIAQGLRLLRCTGQIAADLRTQIQQRVEIGEIQVPVKLCVSAGGRRESFTFNSLTG